ncbi:hypothetical protein AB4Z54_05510, partial [Streptomyces sp. MCAF7]
SGAAEGELGPDAYRDVLAKAAKAWDREPGRALSTFSKPSQLAKVADQLAALKDPQDTARQVLGLPDTAAPGQAEYAKLFWAMVKAREAFAQAPDLDAFGARVLHLEKPDRGRRGGLFYTVAAAAAVGRDPHNADAVAAFQLGREGFLPRQTGVSSVRNWAGLNLSGGVDASKVKLSNSAQQTSPWHVKNGPEPVVVTAEPTGDGRIALTNPAGSRRVVTEDELVELLAYDRTVYRHGLDVPLVLAMPELRRHNRGLPHKLMARLGRAIWYTDDAMNWSGLGTSAPAVIGHTGDPAAKGNWHVARPAVSQTTIGARVTSVPAPSESDPAHTASSAPPPVAETDTPAGPRLRPGPERRAEIRQAPQVEAYSADVPEESATSGWGMPRDNQLRFQAFADQRELVIDVRPTNVDSVKWLTLGALPKPVEIKAKTINALDVRLGAREENRGLVGFFEPRLPEGVSADDPVQARYQQRLKEYQSLRAQMDELSRAGRYRTVNGVVHAVTDDGTRRPLTGDHDIFRISRPDGSSVPVEQYEALIEEMKNSGMGVTHGALLEWDPQDAFGQEIYDTISAAHLSNGGEPLLRFVPRRKSSTVAYADSASDTTSTDENVATPHGDERTLDGTSGKGKARALDGAPSRDPRSVPQADIALAGEDWANALSDYTDAVHLAETLSSRVKSGTGRSTDTSALTDARARVDQAYGQLAGTVARLRDLGVDPFMLGPGGLATAVPVIRRDDAQRRWIASHITAEDVPEDLSSGDLDGVVTVEELRAAGIPPLSGQLAEYALREGWLPIRVLEPVDQVRALMVRPGPWPELLDEVAANASRRMWQSAYAVFKGAAQAARTGTTPTEQDVERDVER